MEAKTGGGQRGHNATPIFQGGGQTSFCPRNIYPRCVESGTKVSQIRHQSKVTVKIAFSPIPPAHQGFVLGWFTHGIHWLKCRPSTTRRHFEVLPSCPETFRRLSYIACLFTEYHTFFGKEGPVAELSIYYLLVMICLIKRLKVLLLLAAYF